MDKNYLMEKKKTSSSKIPGIFFVTRNPCDQEKILLFKKQSLDEDKHLRENNDRVSICIVLQPDSNKKVIIYSYFCLNSTFFILTMQKLELFYF